MRLTISLLVERIALGLLRRAANPMTYMTTAMEAAVALSPAAPSVWCRRVGEFALKNSLKPMAGMVTGSSLASAPFTFFPSTVPGNLVRRMVQAPIVRAKSCRTTWSRVNQDRPGDLVKRQFSANRPNQLWVTDLTYVTTGSGFVYTAFIVNVFARRIVGWRVEQSLGTDLVFDVLKQALWARGEPKGLIHHSDPGSQYLSIR